MTGPLATFFSLRDLAGELAPLELGVYLTPFHSYREVLQEVALVLRNHGLTHLLTRARLVYNDAIVNGLSWPTGVYGEYLYPTFPPVPPGTPAPRLRWPP